MRRRRRVDTAVVGVAAVCVMGLAAVGAGWWASGQRARMVSKPAVSAPRVLAVLPFEHITRDGKPGYFGAGMTEEVMNQLSKVNALRVVSRAAVAKFTDVRTDLAAMTRELGIGSVVTGSVREDAGRVRVNVELVDARSGQQLWSEQSTAIPRMSSRCKATSRCGWLTR